MSDCSPGPLWQWLRHPHGLQMLSLMTAVVKILHVEVSRLKKESDTCFRWIGSMSGCIRTSVCAVWASLPFQIGVNKCREKEYFYFSLNNIALIFKYVNMDIIMHLSYTLMWMQNFFFFQWGRGVISLQADHSRIRHWCQSISSHNSPLFPFFSAYSHLPIVSLFHSETLAICPRLFLSPSYCVYLQPNQPQSERLDSKTWVSERDSQGQTVSGCLSFKSAPVV